MPSPRRCRAAGRVTAASRMRRPRAASRASCAASGARQFAARGTRACARARRRARRAALGAAAPHGDRLDDRQPSSRASRATSISMPRVRGDVDHVQRHHHRPAELLQLEHQAQVQAQVGRIDDADDHVGRRLAGERPSRTSRVIGSSGLRARRVRRRAGRASSIGLAGRRVQPPVLALDRDAGVVRDLLAAPVSGLNSAVLPQLGLPTRATRGASSTMHSYGTRSRPPPRP